MQLVMLILAAVAALIHAYIFVLESLWWERPATRQIFGTTPETAAVTKPLAFNQGFYNLFLGLIVAAGIVTVGAPVVSTALLIAGLGAMLGAALVLVLSDPGKRRAALVQGSAPLLALAALAVVRLA